MTENPARSEHGACHTHAERTQVKIDWLACTFKPLSVGKDFITACGWDIQGLDHGGLGYEFSGIILGTGRVYWSKLRDEMHVSLGGQALAMVGDIRGYMLLASSVGATWARVDVALDDRRGLIDWETLEAQVRAGHLTTRWKGAKLGQDVAFTQQAPDQTGRIIRFGSRKSDLYLRIYDKRQQVIAQGEPDPGHWIRVELETKHDKAPTVAALALKGDGDALKGLIRGYLEFKEPHDGDSNKRRWQVSPWWSDFLDGVPKAFGLFATETKRTIEQVKQWIEHAVAPSLALALESVAGDLGYFLKVVADGRRRWKPHQLAMLEGTPG